MTALTKDRNTASRVNLLYVFGMAAATKIYAGSIVCVDATGFATPGIVSTALTAVGRAEEQVDNSAGADADVTVQVSKGVFLFANAGDITIAHIGALAYINDDQTVSSVSTSKTTAGTIKQVDSDGVWVEIV